MTSQEKANRKAAYYQDHKEEACARSRAYYQDHKEERRVVDAAYYQSNRVALLERSAKERAEFVEWLSILRTVSGCEDCGAHEGRLHHHHIDPSTKKYNVSDMYSCSLDTLEDELEKCVVLCRSCHRKRHAKGEYPVTSEGRANKNWTRRQPCLICGGPSGDPHHWPVRKGQGAGDGLLEIVPMCRRDHDLAHEGDHRVLAQLEEAGQMYHKYVREMLGLALLLTPKDSA